MFLLFAACVLSLLFTPGYSYVASVVEFAPTRPKWSDWPLSRDGAVKLMLKNLGVCEQYIQQAKSAGFTRQAPLLTLLGAQIIVFPEYGLTGPAFPKPEYVDPFCEEIPDPASNVCPCEDWDPRQNPNTITYMASCLAHRYSIALVIDMADKVLLANGSTARYNTQVAFDTNGLLLQKYHKEHLYYEPQFDYPVNQPPKSFTTSFGVTFGMGICFDIIFEEPMMSLVRAGVKDFVYSTWWVNTPPILSAVTMQQSWSYINKINLLAAGAGTGWYNSGSGIYISGVPSHYIYNSGTGEDNYLFTSTIPDPSPAKEIVQGASPSVLKGDSNTGLQTAIALIHSNASRAIVSVANLTCTLDYSLNQINQTYALIAYDGNYWPTFRMTSCGLYLCATDATSCLQPQRFALKGEGSFKAGLQLKAVFSNTNTRTVLPVVSQTDGQLVQGWDLKQQNDYTYILKSTSVTKIQGFSVIALDIAPGDK